MPIVLGVSIGAAALIAVVGGGTAAAIATLSGSGTQLTCTATTGGSDGSTALVAGFDANQIGNAATIVSVGKQLNVPTPGWVVAITAALQESDLVNVDHGDRDSLGLFQERPSQGWGTPTQIMDPAYSSAQFYRHLVAVPHWQQLTINDAAQAVERSGHPQAYGPHVSAAEQIVAAVSGAHCANITGPGTGACPAIQAPNPVALAAITFACKQLGEPYLWGGNGPALTDVVTSLPGIGGFDCSGLTRAAYAAAGVQIPRTAQTQYMAGPAVPAGQPILPGDLVFFGSGPRGVTHVGIVISAGNMIDAPHTGAVVRIEPVWHQDFVGATRPAATRGT